jgi:DNA processing protein
MKMNLSKLDILTLLSTEGISRRTVQSILKNVSFAPSNLVELYSVIEHAKKLKPNIKLPSREQLEFGRKKSEKILELASASGVQVISISDSIFPPQLSEIQDPPLILYLKGNSSCLSPALSVAVIGTRHPTSYGVERAERIAQLFAEQGLIVVSGLADGCDTAAHVGCLRANGKTVAVLAHGLDIVYPAKNKSLANRIVDYGGCLVSEYPVGEPIRRNYFVERDRIQSGLSSAVVVIETDLKGGTMHTVNFCLDQGKMLACLNHALERQSEKSRGNQKLIQDKRALPLRTPEELDKFIKSRFGKALSLDLKPIPPTNLIVKNPEVLPTETKATLQEEVIFDIPISKNLFQALNEKCKSIDKTLAQVISELVKQFIEKENTSEEQSSIKEKAIKDDVEADASKVLEANGVQLDLPLPITQLRKLEIVTLPDDKASESRESLSPTASLPKSLNQKDLAKRLKVSTTTVRNRSKKSENDFEQWSQTKDPDALSWTFSDGLYSPNYTS